MKQRSPEDTIMARRISAALAVLLLAALGAGAASAANGNTLQQKLTRLGYAQGATVDKIQDYKLDGWNYLDDKHIMIYTGPSQRYLVSLMTTCQNLSTAEHIRFSTTVNQLTKFDKLVVGGPGGIKQQCPITGINKLDSIKDKK
jgi:hypothetical protein